MTPHNTVANVMGVLHRFVALSASHGQWVPLTAKEKNMLYQNPDGQWIYVDDGSPPRPPHRDRLKVTRGGAPPNDVQTGDVHYFSNGTGYIFDSGGWKLLPYTGTPTAHANNIPMQIDFGPATKRKPRTDVCPKCGDEGEWRAMALVCRHGHGVFMG